MNEIQGHNWRVIVADVLDGLRLLPDESVHCCVTSPPYFGLRDYGVDGQIGLEKTPTEFVDKMTEVFREVRRVLRSDGTCWINLGDSYANDGKWGGETGGKHRRALHGGATANGRNKKCTGYKPKDLMGMPWQVAFALRDDGWYLRQDVIWSKPNPMPESTADRCTKAHEYIFLLSKSARYAYDAEAVKEKSSGGTYARLPGNKTHKGTAANQNGDDKQRTKAGLVDYAERQRKLAESGSGTKNNGSFDAAMAVMPATRNLRSVWTIGSEAYSEAHFATFPSELPRRCIKSGTSEAGCCSACGAPWRRIVASNRIATRPGTRSKVRRNGASVDRQTGDLVECPNKPWAATGIEVGNRDPQRHVSLKQTIGWQASCDCGLWVCPSGCNLIESVSSTFHGKDADENSLQEEMRGVQKELRDRGQSQDMLRTDVRSQDVVNEFKGTETASVEGEAKEVQGVRNRVQAGGIENAILRQGVLAKTHDQTPEECKGVVQERQGIHPGLHANPSASNEPGLCNATPACDGNVSKAIAATGRSGSSQKRAKRRQSAREPGSDAHAATQQASEGQEANNDQVPLLQRHAPVIKCCPRCGENCEWIPRPTEPCTVLDIFSGSGTTGMVATELGRQYIGIELNPAYAELSRKRIESWKYRGVAKAVEPLAGQKELFG